VSFLNSVVESPRWLLGVVRRNEIMALTLYAEHLLYFGLSTKQLLLLLLEFVDVDYAPKLANVTKVRLSPYPYFVRRDMESSA
jgi:hypothetical protein